MWMTDHSNISFVDNPSVTDNILLEIDEDTVKSFQNAPLTSRCCGAQTSTWVCWQVSGSLLVSCIDLAVDGGGLLEVWGSSGVTLGELTTWLGGLASEAIQPNSSHKAREERRPSSAYYCCSSVFFSFVCEVIKKVSLTETLKTFNLWEIWDNSWKKIFLWRCLAVLNKNFGFFQTMNSRSCRKNEDAKKNYLNTL